MYEVVHRKERLLLTQRPPWPKSAMSLGKWNFNVSHRVRGGSRFPCFHWIHQNIFYCKWQKPNSNKFNLVLFFFFKQWDLLTHEIRNPKDICLSSGRAGSRGSDNIADVNMSLLHLSTSFWVLASCLSRFSSCAITVRNPVRALISTWILASLTMMPITSGAPTQLRMQPW